MAAKTDNTMDLLNLQFTGLENEQQLIIFTVGSEEFGLDVLRVQEIIRYVKPTKIPHAPDHVQGVIDFRGEVIPVFNLRQRFGLPVSEQEEFQVIIVVEANGKTLGLVVDSVSDILNLPEDKIQKTPDFSSREKTRYLKAVGKLGERLILLLDLDKIINLEDQQQLEEIVAAEKEEFFSDNIIESEASKTDDSESN